MSDDPRPRLVPTSPTTAVEAAWSRALCCFCLMELAEGDLIACRFHRQSIEMERMPWEVAVTERVLIYGSRTWRDPEPIRAVIDALPSGAAVIHGGAAGADSLAGQLAQARGLVVEVYPADWQQHGKAAGPIRNGVMAKANLTRAYGFRMPGKSSGADDMTRHLVAAGVPHEVTQAD